ncbi:MAG: PDGLE domain-containing protein [Nitrososphaeria archaeon]
MSFARAWFLIILLLLVSPLFGVILANAVGYHEPLDLAAELLNKPDLTEDINWTPFLDYSVPGVPSEIGYIISGFIGITLILSLGTLLRKIVTKGRLD